MENSCTVLLLVLLTANCTPSSGSNCMSSDGSVPGLNEQIQQKLTDPNSLEVYSTTVIKTIASSSPELKGYRLVLIDFGARNGFGGMVRREALAALILADCVGVILSLNATEFIESGSYEAVFGETIWESVGKLPKGRLDGLLQRSQRLF